MNFLQILKKILTPPGINIYPGDLLFADRRVGFVLRKIRTGDRFYFQIRWIGMTEHMIDEFSGLEIREKIDVGDWRYSPTIIKKEKIRKN